jgi:hypothetical protein
MSVGATNLFASIKDFSLSSESLIKAGGAVKGVAQVAGGAAQWGQADTEAAALKLQARQSAENILRATAKRRGAARAATAASGVKIDEFSMANEDAIQQAGEQDAAFTILNGSSAARTARSAGMVAFAGGLGSGIDSLMQMDLSGWKGAKEAPGVNSSQLDSRYTDNGIAQA